jgi:hypothetical protein
MPNNLTRSENLTTTGIKSPTNREFGRDVCVVEKWDCEIQGEYTVALNCVVLLI